MFKWFKDWFRAKASYDFSTSRAEAEPVGHLLESGRIPGISYGIADKNSVLVQKAFGFSNVEKAMPLDPQHIFRIASVSKPIAALGLGVMLEEGLIDLQQSIYEIMPDYPYHGYDIQVGQLANHTAGIRSYIGKEYFLNKAYSIRQGLDVFKNDPLLFTPGTSYYYNSYDFCVLSYLMELQSGMPYINWIQQKVLQPLQLMQTGEEKDYLDRLVHFYTRRGSKLRDAMPVNNSYKLAGGGLVSNVSDLLKLGQALLQSTLLQLETQNKLTTACSLPDGSSTYYGYGFESSSDVLGNKYFGHTGNGVGGYAIFRVYPDLERVVSILVHCTNPRIEIELEKLVANLLEN
ncbi:MAG: beta-lactamase family protein [Flavobacteriaceae bacterium]|nr:beta-lactamase family protein [Flavobacteriaceae bacterium]